MKRRRVLEVLAAGLAMAAVPARAQERRVPRIGLILGGNPPKSWSGAFREGMRRLGRVEERDYLIDPRMIGEAPGSMTSVVEALVASQPDVLLCAADEAAQALAAHTRTIPIVLRSPRTRCATASRRACSGRAAT